MKQRSPAEKDKNKEPSSNRLISRLYRQKNNNKSLVTNVSRDLSLPSAPQPYLVPKITRNKLKPIQTDSKMRSKIFSHHHQYSTEFKAISSSKNISEFSVNAINISLPPLSKVRTKVYSIIDQSSMMLEKQFAKVQVSKQAIQQDKKYLTPNDFMEILKIDAEMSDEFCYMNKKDNHYDWEIVQFQRRNPDEYMVISKRGLTKYLHNEVEFIKFEAFLQEQAIYNRLNRIEYFRVFNRHKCFQLWKKLTSMNIFKQRTKQFQEKTLLSDEYFKDLTLQVRNYLKIMENVECFNTNLFKPLQIQQFKLYTIGEKQKSIQKIKELEEIVFELLSDRSQASMQAYMGKMRVSKQNKAMPQKKVPLLIGDESAMDMPYTIQATIKIHKRRIRNFLKMTDYLMITSKTQLINNLLKRLGNVVNQINYLYKEDKKSFINTTWIEVNIQQEEGELTFNPTRQVILEELQQIVYGTLSEVCNANFQYLHREQFDEYWRVNHEAERTDQHIELKNIISINIEFNHSVNRFKHQIRQAFRNLQKYAQIYQPSMSYLKFLRETLEIQLVDRETEFFKQTMLRCKNAMTSLGNIEPQKQIGIFFQSCKGLKQLIQKTTDALNQKIFKTIPDIMLARSQKMLHDIKENYILIQYTPLTIKEYIDFLNNSKNVNKFAEQLEPLISDTTDLLILSENYSIKIGEPVKNSIGDANGQMMGLKRRLDQIEKGSGDMADRFKKQIEKLVPTFGDRVKEHREKFGQVQAFKNSGDMNKKIAKIKEFSKSLAVIVKEKNQLQSYQEELGLQVSLFEEVQNYQRFFIQVQSLWQEKKNWASFYEKNWERQLSIVNFQQLKKYIEKLNKKIIVFTRQLEPNEVVQNLKSLLDKFKPTFLAVQALQDKQLKQKHYQEIRNIIRQNFKGRKLPCGEQEIQKLLVDMQNSSYSFKYFKELEVDKFKDEIVQIAVQAAKEAELTEMIVKVEAVWRTLELVSIPYRQKEGTILGNNDDLITKIDDNLMIVNNILGSKYVGPIKPRVEIQSKMLRYIQDLIDQLYLHQKNWIYLEPILKSPFALKNLPKQSNMFSQIDNKWKQLMKQVKDTNIIRRYSDEHNSQYTLKLLISNNQLFDQIQKTLQNFLQKKRDLFQRFYFLSNDQLLQILSTVKSYQQIQPHLRKVFENFVKIRYDDKGIPDAMVSLQGESVTLRNCVFRGEVQQWFKIAQQSMKNTLKSQARQSLQKYTEQGVKRVDWIELYPSQMVLVTDCIMWTTITEGYLQDPESMDILQWYGTNVSQLNELVDLIRTDLKPIQRKKLVALITQDVHYRDIVESLQQCESVQDFKWLMQLRFYYANQIIFAKQVQAELFYGYQYLGATSRLVITPLTDRCWITITGALHIKLGANPAGPAGTGKTQSCKDLAKSLARYCIVFNCSDQINALMMEKLFSGLAYTGSWTCLDQFNRIDIQVLSVISQQVLTIRQALLMGKHNRQLVLGGKTISLNHDLGIFITMNPGYAGRTELPDNLKILFRPVSMMVPDYTLIAEIMLFSEGFSTAKELSKKMTKLYKLSSQQLSQQDHYDFGMRAVKSVLVMAGSLKRAEPDVQQNIILIRAMQSANVPKFLSHDLPLFNGIIEDLFPSVKIAAKDQSQIINKLTKKCQAQKIVPTNKFIEKNLQLDQTLNVRFGVMLVGPPMGTKTTIIKTLLQEFPMIINPKSVSLAQLYGNFDPLTQTWTDGLAAKQLRQSANSHQYVLFDGPVDSLWIENLNTVLDDSMMLCLSNGQRIKLSSKMRILFEVMDLNQASPATVSRCGMVYVPQDTISSQDLIISFFSQNRVLKKEQHMNFLINMVKSSFKKGYFYVKKFCREMVKTNQLTLTHSYCKFIKNSIKIIPQQALEQQSWKKSIEKVCVYSYVWSVGAIVSEDSKNRVDKSLSECFSPDALKSPINNFSLSFKDRADGQWLSWNSIMPEFQYIQGTSFSEVFVPTKEAYCYTSIMEMFVNNLDPIFLTAPTGTGKTSMISQLIKKPQFTHLTFTYTAQTSPAVAQSTLESKLQAQRKAGNVTLIPPPGKKFIYFIDDINMPTVQQYGAQPPIEMLRLLLGSSGVWDRKNHSFKSVEGVQMIIAGTHGRTELPARFLRFFNSLYVSDLEQQSIVLIFSQILKGVFRQTKMKAQVMELIENKTIVNATLQLYTEFKRQLLPTPDKSHYLFNLRDVSRVIQGITIVKPSTLVNNDVLAKLWVHQFQRVFEDRLIDDKDRHFVRQEIAKKVVVLFKSSLTQENLYLEPIVFCNFLKKGAQKKQMIYEQSKDFGKLSKVINDYMTDQTKMNLVLFKDAVLHVCKVARTLIFEKGHILLVGLSGSGKKSIITLAGVLGQSSVQTIQLKKNYRRMEFRQDIFRIMKKAAFENQTVTFLFPQNHILEDSFLQDINNLLSSGQVPSMLSKENLQEITQVIGYELFLKRVIANLHVCLTLSPIGNQFRSRVRNFPSLVNCCLIDWVDVWPQQALIGVAKMKLDDNSVNEACVFSQKYIEKLCNQFYISTRRRVYVTPKNYIELMNSFNYFLNHQKNKIDAWISKLSNGVFKLQETSAIIANLKVKLTELQPILQQKTIEQQQLLKKLQVDRQVAGQVKEVVEIQERQISEKAENAMNEKKQADRILNQALPALHAANEALNTLNRNDISEIKMNQKPHDQVKFTLECVAVLIQEKQDWQSVRKFISDVNFITRLKNLDVYNIPLKVQQNLKAKIKTNANFKPNQIKNINFAAKSFCEWVLSVLNFCQVNKEIVKKKTIVKKLNDQLEVANKALQSKRDQLSKIVQKVKELESMYLDSKDQKEKLDNEIILTNKRLVNAEALTDGLGNQKLRWAEYLIELAEQKKSIVGNTFLATCCVVYYGPFTGHFRQMFVDALSQKLRQLQITISERFQLSQVLSDNMQISEWISYSLPKDIVSINNAVLVSKTLMNPMMIDPQLQASRWIKNMEKKNNLVQMRIGSDNFLKKLESAIRMKYSIILQTSQNSIDPALDALLSKDFEHNNNRCFVKLGQNKVQIDSTFKIFVYTKIANPSFSPEVFIKLCVINFTVTPQGLQDQLLASVVENQLPQVQSKKRQLVSIISKGKVTLQKNEDKILQLLNNSKGNILDDEQLIANLKESKKVSTEVKLSLQENQIKSKQIEQARQVYKPVAKRGTVLYMIVAELSNIDPMYQFSLQYFSRIFVNVLVTTTASQTTTDRISSLLAAIAKTVYTNISRGLFNQHKKILSFMMAVRIEEVPKPEYDYFNKGNFVITDKLQKPAKNINGLTPQKCLSLYNLKKVFANDVYEFLSKGNDKLQHYNESPLSFFRQSKLGLSNFQQLILVKTLNPQLTLEAITEYISSAIGSYFVQAYAPTTNQIYNDLSNKIPLVFVLSVGADPLQSLIRLSKQKDMRQDQMAVISLGQGQQKPALQAIENMSKEGGWVILQNCHLGKSFMAALQKKVEEINDSSQIHASFRLYLTCMPCDYFPVSILQNSLKVTSEPPRGIKANLKKIINSLTWKQTDDQKTFTFNLCLFHAIVLERRKFGSLGWNILYDFNESDLETSLTVVNNLLQTYEDIQWDAIQYFVGEIIYGGRITDEFDRRLLKTMLLEYISPQSIAQPKVPPGQVSAYMEYIDKLSQEDNPQLFGMHQNAQTSYLYKISKEALDSIMLLQPQQALSNDTQKTLNIIQSIKERVPAIIKRMNQIKTPDAIDICLEQQSVRFNKLIQFIEKNLTELILAVKGQAVMTQVLEKTFVSLTNNQVPQIWQKLAYPSIKPLSSWFQDFLKRIAFFRNALNQRPKSYWLSAFFFPQGFLTSILQIYARKNKLPVDTLGFNFNLTKHVIDQFNEASSGDGCYIHGLYSEACIVDFKSSLLKQAPLGIIYSDVPVILFKPVQIKNEPLQGVYNTPVYKTLKRAGTLSTTGHSTNYIISIACKSEHDEGFWTKRGAAFFCALDK